MNRIHVGRIPDPLRAHGALAYLFVSVVAGVLAAAGEAVWPALFAGLGYIGVFVLASGFAIAAGARRDRRLAVGLGVAVLGPFLALELGADPTFLLFGTVALVPAAIAGMLAERDGFHSKGALAFAVAALAVAAPAVACAGGATPTRSWTLLALLAPFFACRTYAVRVRISSNKGWNRAELRKQGYLEVAFAVVWMACALGLLQVFA